MNDEELYMQALEACQLYYGLYGAFPEKLGVSQKHWRLWYRSLRLVEPWSPRFLLLNREYTDEEIFGEQSKRRHEIPFEILETIPVTVPPFLWYPDEQGKPVLVAHVLRADRRVEEDQVWCYHEDRTDWLPASLLFAVRTLQERT